MIPSLFPMCVYDATKSYKAQAYEGSAQGDLVALLDPVKAGAFQRHAEIVILVRRAELSNSKICSCYCILFINTETKVNDEIDSDDESDHINIPQEAGNNHSYSARDCMITHASWDSGGPVFMNRRNWSLKDLARQKISIELWGKRPKLDSSVIDSHCDILIASDWIDGNGNHGFHQRAYNPPRSIRKEDLIKPKRWKLATSRREDKDVDTFI
jgi:hypothetical protein